MDEIEDVIFTPIKKGFYLIQLVSEIFKLKVQLSAANIFLEREREKVAKLRVYTRRQEDQIEKLRRALDRFGYKWWL